MKTPAIANLHFQPPAAGLGAARMSALLTYRSRNSFEARFGRNIPDPRRRLNINGHQQKQSSNEHWAIHNDGHQNAGSSRPSRVNSSASVRLHQPATPQTPDPEFSGNSELPTPPPTASSDKKQTPTYFSAQSYLRYQGSKFIKRFDANCYIAITRKLDTHDISRSRDPAEPIPADDGLTPEEEVEAALAKIEQPTLILGIESDGLFTFAEQQELAAAIPHSRLETIDSSEGHDAFLLEFEQVNAHVLKFMHEVLPNIMSREPDNEAVSLQGDSITANKSLISEADSVEDITAW
jgi:homoserine O-acetyltransferase